ncbi:type II toxin-antitoxin system VapC family toxin [Novosphingobium sp.]|uniref:type II toxin-antitoxin system VapC family toxin n=1 Tax=Novosphingobium sp. TaxID=1874826 RepID=UPI0038B93F49
MNITADTNILVRAITGDDPVQSRIAERLLTEAKLVALPDAALCELCWVLARVYRFGTAEIAHVIRTLMSAENVAVEQQRVNAGLAILEAGGDFADGIVAHSGQWLGGETFVSFDQKAVALLKKQGVKVMLPQ